MITAFGDQIYLVGLADDDDVIGEWRKKYINNIEYNYFPVLKVKKRSKKSIIPYRLKSFIAVRFHIKQILSINIKNVFIQTPEVLFALKGFNVENLCVRIPGVGNPLRYSRYSYGKLFASVFDYFFFRDLVKSDVILATADQFSINEFIKRGNNILSKEKVKQFPTRFNSEIFKPTNKSEVRKELGFTAESKIVVTTGRISELKGWKFMIDSFNLFRIIYPNSMFYFIGDGEDRQKAEKYITNIDLNDYIKISGSINHSLLSKYLNAADVFVMGSYIEGWATSLVEAISCSLPVVCTNFSSASELIEHGVNGYIINNRNEDEFSKLMIKSLKLSKVNLNLKAKEIQQYSTLKLKEEIEKVWNII
jgi:glycosyltransferase involved in cell wall biosynthesis